MKKPYMTSKTLQAIFILICLFCALFMFTAIAFSQDMTTVSGTIVDSDTITWAYGSWKAQLINPRGGQVNFLDGSGQPVMQYGFPNSLPLDNTGSFSQSVANNAALAPAGTYWQFTFCPNASYQCTTVPNLAFVTGQTTYNISTLATANIKPPRFSAQGPNIAWGYSDIEVSPPPNGGGMYWNVNTLNSRCWTGTTAQGGTNAWENCGGPGSSLTLQYNGSATGIDQSLLNNTDNGTLTPDAGYTEAKFLTNSGGAWAVEYLQSSGLQTMILPSISGNYAIVYPTGASCATGGTTCNVINTGCSSSSPTCAAGQITATTTGAPAAQATWTFTNALETLPVPVNPASVTAVYAIGVSNYSFSGNPMFAYVLSSGSSTSTGTIGPPNGGINNTSAWVQQQGGPILTTLTGAQVDSSSYSATLSSSQPVTFDRIKIDTVAYIVAYTGAAQPAGPNTLKVVPPLGVNVALNELYIDTTYPFPGKYAVGYTIGGTLPSAASAVIGQSYFVNNASSTDTNCTATGSSPEWCVTYNGTSFVSFGNGSGSSGVISFSGDGSLLNNSASTGAVTATLANTGVGYGIWGNTGSSSGTPGYHALSSYPTAAFPTLNQNTTGNAATSTGLASYPTLCTGGQFSQGLSGGPLSNNCATPTGGITTLIGDVSASGSGSVSAMVKGIDTVPLCTGFTPTNGQNIEYTTGSSPNPCYTAVTPSGGFPTGTTNGAAYYTGSAGAISSDVLIDQGGIPMQTTASGASGYAATENSAVPNPTSGQDQLFANSTNHWWEMNSNGAGTSTALAGTSTTAATTGHCPQYTGPYTIGDSGSATCGGGGALTLISRQTLSSTAASITFSSIPGTFVDLILRCEGRGAASANFISALITFNSDTSANYRHLFLQGTGSTVSVQSGFSDTSIDVFDIPAASATANYSGGGQITINDYSGTSFFKHAEATNGLLESAAAANTFHYSGSWWWASTSAITQITITSSSGNFVIGTTCGLFGSL